MCDLTPQSTGPCFAASLRYGVLPESIELFGVADTLVRP